MTKSATFLPRTLTAAAAVALLTSQAHAAPPPGYYDSANGLSGQALKDALHSIIDNHTVLPYSSSSRTDTRDALEVCDEDPTSPTAIQPYYRITSMEKSAFGSSGATKWNREHCWPQSQGADVSPKVSDLHHIFAEEAALNSTRNNSVYDDFSINSPTTTPGSRDGNSWTGYQFQVRPASRGNVARAILYMTVRYPEMTLSNDLVPAYNQMGRKAVLLKWHQEDPVDAREQLRNDTVYSFQGNRNPFIDHPEYVDLIYGDVTDGDTLQISSTDRAASTVGAGSINYPLLSVNLQPDAHEWDLGSMTVTRSGSLIDASITAVKLFRDTNANGIVDAGEPLLATSTFSGGAATLTCSAPSRVTAASPGSFLVTASLSGTAANGDTLQVQVTGVTHASSGGADTDYPSLSLSSSPATVSGGVTSGDSVNVTASNLAAGTISAGAVNFPLMAVDVNAATGEWDMASLTVNKVGGVNALPDSQITSLRLYADVDSSNAVSEGDTLLATTTFAGASATFTPGSPYRVTTTPMRLIVVASLSGSASNGKTLQVELPSGGMANSSTGGADNAAGFSTFTSNASTVINGVTDGDSATVNVTDVAPATVDCGSVDVPMLSLELAAGSNEWDLGTIAVNRTGIAPNSAVTALSLYHDADGDGQVDADETLLATTTFTGAAATLNVNGALRVTSTPVKVLLAVNLSATGPNGYSVGLSLPADAVSFSPTGGADQNPVFAGFTGGTSTLTNAAASPGVKIVMVSTRATTHSVLSPTGTAGNAEFLVLANQTDSAVPLTGWQLKKYSSNVTLNLSGTIPPHSHFLIASNHYVGASNIEGSTADLYLSTANILGGLTDTGPVSIGLFDNNGTKIDGFSWGGNAAGDTVEPYYRDTPALPIGLSLTSTVAANQIIVRKRLNGGSTGPYQDTDSNLVDLQVFTFSPTQAKNPPSSSVAVPVTVSGFSLE